METRKLLVVSTRHVSTETARMLNNTHCTEWPCIGGPYADYGWIVYAHEDARECPKTIPADLFAVMKFATANGFDNILFDCDAEAVDGLDTYEW